MPRLGPYLRDENIAVSPGHSLLPLCRDSHSTWPRAATYSESYNAIWSNSLDEWARTIRTRDHRYTFYADGGGEQLFDLRSDPDESNNVAFDAAYSDVRQGLRGELLELVVAQEYPKTRRELFALGVH